MSTIQGEYFFLPQEHVLFGVGSLERLPDEVRRVGGQRVLLVTGNTLATQTDVVKRVVEVLGTLHVGTFSNIRQHAPKGDVAQAADLARSLQTDILVSVGGGSPIDAAKAVAYALAQDKDVYLPHIAMPTTLSAAEFTPSAGVTDEEKRAKAGFMDERMTPRTVLLDATLTVPTPSRLWISTGIRALDHAVETLYARGFHPINDVLALEAICKLFKFLPHSQAHPDDLEARTELQIAAWMSIFEVNNAPSGLSHNLGRRIGATYNVPHGITSCITLPAVMHALAEQHAAQLAPMAAALNLPVSDPVQAAHAAADAVFNLIDQLGLPHYLHDVGIDASEIHSIAVNTVGEGPRLALAESVLRSVI
ncbi:MAG: iron-containing alcohol dehydrogenase [Ktedonobacteraceae bacterium]|nr:iron-containing alcohol dehydrogenase [Ktedonobacteraceae bacterium]